LASQNIPAGDFGPLTFTLEGTTFEAQRKSDELTITVGSSATLSLPLNEADGFLQTLLGVSPSDLHLPAPPKWSSVSGFSLAGLTGSHFTIPLNVNAGVVELKTLELAYQLQGAGFLLSAGVTGDGGLGPLQVSFENVGVQLLLEASGGPGLLTLTASFLPPTGMGVELSAGPIIGGGFLSIDVPNGRYAAVLQISLFGLGIEGFALIDTKLPGGGSGFSFLVLVFADFEAIGGIQLSFGFVLTGVGGVFGIYRSVNTDALRSAVLSNNLDHLLFPTDPIKNAPAIISDLRAVFPPTRDEYVFGPIVRVGWGTPVIIEAELGFVLDLPAFILALLGSVGVYLPVKPAPIVEVHIDIAGSLDPGHSTLELTGSLHDSHILYYTLSGQMEFMLNWGASPSFLFSLGGFNPHFVPPPGVPSIARLRLDIGFGDNPRISMQNYLAVTSNTLQFGAKSELYAAAGPFNVHGWIEFDALFILAPLYFIVDFSAGIDFREGDDVLAGVHLSATLSGPKPWHAEGEASISILFFDASVGFSATVGDPTPASVPPAPDPSLPLAAAISDPHNWSAMLPASGNEVAVISPAASNGVVLVNPLGGVSLTERVLPLNKTITRFAQTKLSAPVQFNLQGVTTGGVPLTDLHTQQDNFAIAQFEDLSDQDKLSQASFTKLDAGFSAGSGVARAANSAPGVLDYYTDYFEPAELTIYILPSFLQHALIATAPSALAPSQSIGVRKYALPPNAAHAVALNEVSFSVVSTTDLSAQPHVTGPVSKTLAYDALKSYIAANPEALGTIQILPTHEVQPAGA
jgi:hypothetical protein